MIISLVRSNRDGAIGFLKEPQRVNVMLSRAKIGIYMVGNSETLCSSKTGRSLWVPLINYMKEYGFYMEGVPSYCQLHPKRIVSLTVTNT